MKKMMLATFAAAALLTGGAGAAPLDPANIGSAQASNVDQVRLVCNEYGRCWRTRGPRYVQRGYDDNDDSYVVRRGYGYYGGPGYYDRPGYGYYSEGPGIGFSFGTRGW